MKKILLILSLFISLIGFSQTKINTGVGLSIATANDAIQGSIVATETSANVYAGSLSWLTNVSGKAYDITFPTANTGSTTFNLNAAGAITLKKFSGGSLVNLASGDISAGETKRIRYNGTFLIIEGGSGSGGGSGTVTSVTSADANATVATTTTTPVITIVSAPKLQTARTIQGTSFDGTANINPLNGTGFVKATGTTISYDNSTYLTSITGISAGGDLTGTYPNPTVSNASVIAKVLTGYTSGSGSVSSTDNILQAIQKLDGNDGLKRDLAPTTNRQTTNYTLVLTDKTKDIEMDVAGANNLTIPPNSSVAFPVGQTINIMQYGAGLTSIVAGAGVTIRTSSGVLTSPGQYSPMVIKQIATDEWYLWNGSVITTAALTRTDDTNVTLTLAGAPTTALNSATSLTLGWTGVLAHSRGGTGSSTGTLGTTTNDNAATGDVGQTISSLVASGSAVSLTTNTAANVTSISLTAGDWDVSGIISFTETSSTVTARSGGTTSTTATVPTDGSEAYCGVQSTVTSEINSISLPFKRFSLSTTTTIFLVGKATFSAGTCAAFGALTARRRR